MFDKNNTDLIDEIAQVQPASKLHKSTILGGKVHIFSRPNSPYFWCGFHHKGKYLRTSTKQEFLKQAEEFADKWYDDKKFEIRAGTGKVGGIKFGKAAEHALAAYRATGRSKEYLRGIDVCLTARVIPFFKDMPVDQIDAKAWTEYQAHVRLAHPNVTAAATLHQHKNALRIVLNEACIKGWLSQVPTFKKEYSNKGQSKPRTWFDPKGYRLLVRATRSNIARLKKTRHAEAAKELHDFVLFVANTGFRIGEAHNVRFCDVETIKVLDDAGKERQVLLIKNILGKRGTGECKSHFGAVEAYKRIVARRNPGPGSQEKLFVQHHRDMFNSILRRINLKFSTGRPPARRDLMSLRHTYICMRLLKGASVFDVAANCRTSVTMIQKHYAQFLSPRMTTSINRELKGAGFGAEDKGGA